MTCDFLIIGAGIIGLSMAHNLRQRYPEASIVVIDKEPELGRHASGRNSGVLHAGFYYTAESLKARFTREGNAAMRAFCHKHGLAINECGKLVVARNESERQTLHELLRRGEANGVDVRIVSEEEAREIEPNCRTYREALHSPTTATVDPKAVLRKLREIVTDEGTRLMLGNPWMGNLGNNHILTRTHSITAGRIINCAGLYADRIAQAYGFGERYTILPFKGIYLKYSGSPAPLRTNIYPVPKLENPFLGVHYTVTVDGTVKIGPTAIPAFWRENYQGLSRFRPDELSEILWYDAKLFLSDSFGFRRLALEEFRKYSKKHLAALAAEMVQQIEPERFDTWSTPGIRAQLLDKESLELVHDFIVEGDEKSLHILNAVSPAFTCALPFTEWVIGEHLS
ncbi:L-2-hydroxyglutarate oxidase [Nitratifractor salsuginis]|uniref:FAD dependent oxidoreductase n=1 Tax=Nitratifractor salsuginis (strain DSM 16511 / JCM 12458 / E9I37-1) TaxID=749222 RepID=E6WYT1_NITSE|nr:L-2-hydroxyglutarate oxidase [Nitratifractor salsuginis]ADV46517.1 FAD dependent oxidoreductase [Nitratifractor salsuginis DSM 16511]